MDETFKVWVGCLACYNDGRLVGEWFDAVDAPQDMEAFDTALEIAPGHRLIDGHEELWCFDTENSPVSGEMSPMDAQIYAGLIEDLEIPLDALKAWLSDQHEELTEDSIETATERYWTSDEESFDDSIRDLCPEGDLPKWALTGYEAILENIKRDMRLNGEYVELDGHYFRTH